MLRIWAVREHRVKRSFQLENPSRAVCYNPEGALIAVGFGSPLEASVPGKRLFDGACVCLCLTHAPRCVGVGASGGKDACVLHMVTGKWIVVEERNFNIVHEARDSTKWITEIKWSPNGTLLAVGSFDNKIYVYSADSHYALSTVISQHNSWIKHIDFSANSVYMQANCGAYELRYYEADTGLFIPAASRLKDVVRGAPDPTCVTYSSCHSLTITFGLLDAPQKWNSQSCSLGWSVQGIWPAQADGCDITSCDVNFAIEHGAKVAAAADNFGRLRLFRFPVQSSYALPRSYQPCGGGHVPLVGRLWLLTTFIMCSCVLGAGAVLSAGPISKVRWVNGDSHLVTLSARDKTVLQWRHEVDDLAIGQATANAKGGQAAIMQVGGQAVLKKPCGHSEKDHGSWWLGRWRARMKTRRCTTWKSS
jgi:microtubule-associated protein-like 6